VRALAGSQLVDLVDALLPPEERYTYVFDGASQVLDHILVSRSLLATAEVDVVHCAAELPAAERASDHDPVLARLVLQ
jgi:predicted extracellular nuclease